MKQKALSPEQKEIMKMKLVKKNVRYFNNIDEYSDYYENHEHFDYVTDIVESSNNVCADAQYACKSWKTAVKRFFKAIAECKGFEGWDEEGIIESIESGYWNDKSTAWNDETHRCEYTGDYAWTVEELDEGLWYISLKVAL